MAGLASSLSAVVLILCGAINALLSKVVYQLEGVDCSGATKPFAKPWLQTALMFVAMAACLPLAWILEAYQNSRSTAAGTRKRSVFGFVQQEQQSEHSASGVVAAAVRAAEGSGDSDLQQPLLAEQTSSGQHHHLQHMVQDRQPGHTAHAGGGSGSSRGGMWSEGLLLCIPTGFDLAATTLMNVGLLYVAASVFQILRGSEMLFAALFAVVFLHRHLNRWHLIGVALCMAGISLVGASRVLAGDSSSSGSNTSVAAAWQSPVADGSMAAGGSNDPKKALLGMCLILLSQAIQAGQVTVEDYVMADMHMAPLKVVGWEGVIGSLVMLGVALPLLQRLPFEDGSGLAEDTLGSLCMLRSSTTITAVVLLSSFAVLVYNVAGMKVTAQVGAAARTVLENARTLLVWLAALVLYYTNAGSGRLGEAWDSWSWLQAVGFAVFAAGALLYDKGHKQQDEEAEQAGQVPRWSKWAVLKSTLGIHTGHYVGLKKFRATGNAVLAGIRASRLAEEGRNNGDNDENGNSARGAV